MICGHAASVSSDFVHFSVLAMHCHEQSRKSTLPKVAVQEMLCSPATPLGCETRGDKGSVGTFVLRVQKRNKNRARHQHGVASGGLLTASP